LRDAVFIRKESVGFMYIIVVINKLMNSDYLIDLLEYFVPIVPAKELYQKEVE